jgi:MFS family permease
MPMDFYATVAQVLPVLLLALVFESRYLDRTRIRRAVSRTEDPVAGVRFWTKRRVRVYALAVTTVVLLDIVLSLVMLAGYLPDSVGLRALMIAGVVLAGVTLMYRIWMEVIEATREESSPVEAGEDPCGDQSSRLK